MLLRTKLLKGGFIGEHRGIVVIPPPHRGAIIGVIKGDTRSLDYGSYVATEWYGSLGSPYIALCNGSYLSSSVHDRMLASHKSLMLCKTSFCWVAVAEFR